MNGPVYTNFKTTVCRSIPVPTRQLYTHCVPGTRCTRSKPGLDLVRVCMRVCIGTAMGTAVCVSHTLEFQSSVSTVELTGTELAHQTRAAIARGIS